MKISIFEDSYQDLTSRYGSLNDLPGMKMTIYWLGQNKFINEQFLKSHLKENDFKNFVINMGVPKKIQPADLYFLDGLEGHCFNIIKMIPQNRSFVCSGNPQITSDPRLNGRLIREYSDDLDQVIKAFSIRKKKK